MALTINIPNTLRAAVESASGGRCTVLYTAKNQPCYMAVIPKFTVQSIDASLGSGTHPMFVVGGVDKAYRFIGMYPGVIRNGELLSLPGEAPGHSQNHDQFVTLARANGAGWGLMNNADWAGIMLTCWKNGTQPRGNTDYGRSSDLPAERGVDSATGYLAATTGTATGSTRGGSGPASWRHDATAFGIADLCGNVCEWSPGMRLNAGEINIITGNDAALNATDMAVGSAAWKAIDGATGALVAPGTAGTVKLGDTGSGTADWTIYSGNGAAFQSAVNSTGANPVGATALQLLKQHGLFPVASSGLGGDSYWMDITGERLPFRGGGWYDGASCGVAALYLVLARSAAYPDIGARPAFVI